MRPESNPLLQELARSQQATADFEAHLDADLLTALAEDTLLPSERNSVFAHLAVCSECREVLSVTTAARHDAGEGASARPIPRPARTPLWGWLPWAATAAGIAAITTILLFHPHKVLAPATTATNGSPTTSDKATPGQRARIPAEALNQVVVSAPPEAKARHEKPAPPSGAATGLAPARQTTNAAKSQSSEQSGRALALNNSDVEGSSALAAAAQPIAGTTAAKIASQSATVQVTPTQNAILPQTTTAEPGAALGGPLAAGNLTRAFSAVSVRPQWRINEEGQVERSFGNGVWQEVLDARPSKLRVVSVLRGSVWAGGDKLRLYRSLDNGGTWSAVQLPPKGDAANAITHVRFETPLDGKIDAADGSSWITTDGGITWK
jgi:hypothetical protein